MIPVECLKWIVAMIGNAEAEQIWSTFKIAAKWGQQSAPVRMFDMARSGGISAERIDAGCAVLSGVRARGGVAVWGSATCRVECDRARFAWSGHGFDGARRPRSVGECPRLCPCRI